MKRSWYQLKAEDSVAEIQINDFIGDWIDDYFGFGVTAKTFVDELAALPENVKTIRVRINSPGGDVFGAINIANALRDQRVSKGRKVETCVDGLAASAATLVLMAGDPIRVADNALVMVHNPWTIALGNADEMRKQADVLDQVRNTIIATYQWHAELSDKELIKLMDAETWMDADKAIANGFADEKVEGLRAAASIDPAHVAKLGLKVPPQYADRVAAWQRGEVPAPAPADVPAPQAAAPVPVPETPVPARDPQAMPADAIVAACAAAGLDMEFTVDLIKRGSDEESVAGAVAAEKGRREADALRKGTIAALCAKFKQGDLSPEMIEGGMSADAARSLIAKVTALVDRVELDAGLSPDVSAGGAKRKAQLNPGDIYRERNSARN